MRNKVKKILIINDAYGLGFSLSLYITIIINSWIK